MGKLCRSHNRSTPSQRQPMATLLYLASTWRSATCPERSWRKATLHSSSLTVKYNWYVVATKQKPINLLCAVLTTNMGFPAQRMYGRSIGSQSVATVTLPKDVEVGQFWTLLTVPGSRAVACLHIVTTARVRKHVRRSNAVLHHLVSRTA